MTKQILNFIAIARYDSNYDPLLGRNVIDVSDNGIDETPLNNTGSVFDDPDLDFAYVAPTLHKQETVENIPSSTILSEIETETVAEQEIIGNPEPEFGFGQVKEQDLETNLQIDFTAQSSTDASTSIENQNQPQDQDIAQNAPEDNEYQTTDDSAENAQTSEPEISSIGAEGETEDKNLDTQTSDIRETNQADQTDTPSDLIEESQILNQYENAEPIESTTSIDDDLFAPKPKNEKAARFEGLFGAILSGGAKKIRDLGPILGRKGEKFIDVGPILAKNYSQDVDDDSKPVSKVFAEPIFGNNSNKSITSSPVFDEPIFGSKSNESGDYQSEVLEKDIDLWAPSETTPKTQAEKNDFEAQSVDVTIENETIENETTQGSDTQIEPELEYEPALENEPELESAPENIDEPSNALENETIEEALNALTTAQIEEAPNTFESEIKSAEIAQDLAEENQSSTEVNETLESYDQPSKEEQIAPIVSETSTETIEASEDLPAQTSEKIEEPASRVESVEDKSEQHQDSALEENEEAKTRGDILRDKYRQAKRQEHREKVRKEALRAKQKKKKLNPVLFFLSIFATGSFAILTIAAMLAPLGAPFDAISFAKWYIATLGFVSALLWGLMRNWLVGVITTLLLIFNLTSFVPTLGAPARGGKADKIIGWADVNNSTAAFEKTIKEAESNKTDILFLARANLTQIPANWSLLQAPIRNDPNSITILSKGNWAAATLAGEPTMARLLDNSITIIAVNPTDPSKSKEREADRESMINRAAARAGTQETPVIAIGSFDEPSWSRQMIGFAQNGQVTRVRCGGFLGATVNNGLFNLAPDHVFTRGLIVAKCNIGGAMPNGAHRPIWLSVRADSQAAKAQ